jgi:hypothetical protein
MDVGPLAVSLGGANPGDFAITDDHCAGALLMPGTTCTFVVAFAPAAPGSRSGSVTVAAGGDTSSADLSGVGGFPYPFFVMPNVYDFGAVPVGSTSAPTTFTVDHFCATPTLVPAASIFGVSAADFVLVPGADHCSGATLGRATCTVDVAFAPTATGVRTDVLSVGGASADVRGTGE